MRRAPNFNQHYLDNVAIKTTIAEDDYRGVRSGLSDPVYYPGLVDWRHHLIQVASGEKEVARTKVYIKAQPGDIKPGDWVILPDGDERRILSVANWAHAGFLVIDA